MKIIFILLAVTLSDSGIFYSNRIENVYYNEKECYEALLKMHKKYGEEEGYNTRFIEKGNIRVLQIKYKESRASYHNCEGIGVSIYN